jgi:hypothetical protein
MCYAEKDTTKIKFFIVSVGIGRPKPIDDGMYLVHTLARYEILSNASIPGDVLSDYEFASNDSIGIDHIDKSGKSSRSNVERAIKIFVSGIKQSFSWSIIIYSFSVTFS